MSEFIAEKFQSLLIAIGAGVITVLVISGNVTDPVNVPKLLALGVVSVASMWVTFSSPLRFRLKQALLPFSLVLIFVLATVSATLNSKSPLSQNLYGAYGRNNGLITYLFLSFLFISVLTLRRVESFQRFLNALYIAGVVNVVYCLWVLAFGDFVGWSNPYGNILGTLGNPNFIGSFLGIFFGASFAILFSTSVGRKMRISVSIILPLTLFEIVKSHAIQGRVVAALGIAIVLFFFLRSRVKPSYVLLYTLVATVVGAFALAGALQVGPLTSFIYKTSVSLRGQYWLAGWNTGQDHPLTGVGMDSFGDWYRRSRDSRALELPGVDTVVNASHNVPLDMFAFGGWPLFLSYLALLAITMLSIMKVVIRNKSYDAPFVALTVAWLGYQLQSFISINQIGLAIWGWILSASLISYEYLTRDLQASDLEGEISPKGKKKKQKNSNNQQLHLPLVGTVGGIIGLLVALPPFSADVKWRSAQVSQSAAPLEASLLASYLNPSNSMKYLSTIQIFEENQLFDQSHSFALRAVQWNPEAFELWKVLYLIKNSTPEEKMLALSNMKRLDPLNPDVTSIK
jgi:O-antigen ligase